MTYRSKSEAEIACNRANALGGGVCLFEVRKVRGGGWCVEPKRAVPFVDVSNITDADGVARRLSNSIRVF